MERAGVTLEPSPPAIEIRRAEAGDAGEISMVAEVSLGAGPWSDQQFLDAAGEECGGWVAVENGRIGGFLFARVAADEGEILNVGVEPGLRRRGAGGRLLNAAIEFAREHGAKRLFLEVRESNVAAIAFYERAGFVGTGRRKLYYSNPTEDARVLTRTIDPGK